MVRWFTLCWFSVFINLLWHMNKLNFFSQAVWDSNEDLKTNFLYRNSYLIELLWFSEEKIYVNHLNYRMGSQNTLKCYCLQQHKVLQTPYSTKIPCKTSLHVFQIVSQVQLSFFSFGHTRNLEQDFRPLRIDHQIPIKLFWQNSAS
jgi:hypothetical protein